METKTDHKEEVKRKFLEKVEESNRYYNNLKNIPLSLPSSTYQAFFQFAFQKFTDLWNYQQNPRIRQILVKDCNLTRFEVGEVARRIAKLYYQYYLRTANSRYLQLSFQFYEVIRKRSYFEEPKNWKEQSIKLKYFLRFIVVCLYQNKRNYAISLLKEFEKNCEKVPDNEKTFHLKLHSDIENFMKHEMITTIGNNVNLLSYRHPFVDQVTKKRVRISKSIIVSSKKEGQSVYLRFAGITLDTFRFIQSCEYESFESYEKKKFHLMQPRNVKKTNLFETTFSTFIKEMGFSYSQIMKDNEVLLLYFNLNSTKEGSGFVLNQSKSESEDNLLKMDDLLPFLRKPMFLICDTCSNFSHSFGKRKFKKPFCYLYYKDLDTKKADKTGSSIFNLFLASPILGIQQLGEYSKKISFDKYERINILISEFSKIIQDTIQKDCSLDDHLKFFFESNIISSFLINFIIMKSAQKFFKINDLNNLDSFPKFPDSYFSTEGEGSLLVKKIAEILKGN